MLSADRTIDYASGLDRITTPTLMVAGEGDIMADIPSTLLTFDALGGPDKNLMQQTWFLSFGVQLTSARPGSDPFSVQLADPAR